MISRAYRLACGPWLGGGLIVLLACQAFAAEPPYDLVLAHGRVMDPETRLDAIRQIGIRDGRIVKITAAPLNGREVLDVSGHVVAPGFIDLHQHAQDAESYRFKAQDGVTTALELEVGTADVPAWYAAREGKLPIHYGVSIGHLQARMTVMGDRPSFLPAADSAAATRAPTPEQRRALADKIRQGLRDGAVAVGFGIAYTPAADADEILSAFQIAAEFNAPCHVHMRYKGLKGEDNSLRSLQELIATAYLTGAGLHIVHIQSTGGEATPRLLEMVALAQGRGLDLTAECYPYTAGMTDIRSALFNDGWRAKTGLDYGDMQWGATGERLTAETFARYRKAGGLVIVHSNPESIVTGAVASPVTLIASDGLKGHPRNAGTFSRVLGFYVRERGALSLMEALEKITLGPARRLEKRVPALRRKGRVQEGADADLVIFDPATIRDRATFTDADQPSTGILHVLVDGVPVVYQGSLQEGVLPGQPVRAGKGE